MTDLGRENSSGSRGQETGGPTRSVSELCELLADERRRAIVRYLRWRYDTPVSFAELVEYLRTSEAKRGPEEIRVRLRHVHLPKLDEADVIVHTPSEETITYWPDPQLEEFLTVLDRQEYDRNNPSADTP